MSLFFLSVLLIAPLIDRYDCVFVLGVCLLVDEKREREWGIVKRGRG